MLRKRIKFKQSIQPAISGEMLVADFKSAMTNLTTAATAKYMARQSEQDTMNAISQAATHNRLYVTPEDISPDAQAELVRSSLDAHLQKAQSEQIAAFTSQQLAAMEAADKKNFTGKKVKITVLDPEFTPLESYWWDKRTGRSRQGEIKANSIKGVIEDLSFQKNLLILKPTFSSKIILPDRKFIFVYVVNPASLAPAVNIGLI